MKTYGDRLYEALDKIIASTDDENIKLIAVRMKSDSKFLISFLGFCTALSVENHYFLEELNRQYIVLSILKKD